MAFFDKLGETIVNVGKDATQKAKDLSGVAKLNLDIKAKAVSYTHLRAHET